MTDPLLRPLSRMINRRMAPDRRSAVADDGISGARYTLEVTAAEKSGQRLRALVVQALTDTTFVLRSIDVSQRSSHVRIVAGVTVDGIHDTTLLEQAVQRISLDPKVIGGRSWQEEVED